ncbi:MAG: GIY-YIG nuclease family protein [Hyphomicrobiales bacterium]|nr:GIY-YIG nuclease family protein [Hyphomicrobiales bacterium]
MPNYAPTLTQSEVALIETINRSKAVSSRRTLAAKDPKLDVSFDECLWRIDWARLGYPYVGVYCICPDNKWPTKVGVSQNVPKRLGQIQVGVWRQVDVYGYFYCANAQEAFAIEAKTHELMRDAALQMQGEWFDIRPEKAIEFIQFAAEILGIELRKDIPNEEVKSAIYHALLRFAGNPKLSPAAADLKNTAKVQNEYPVLKVAIQRLRRRPPLKIRGAP